MAEMRKVEETCAFPNKHKPDLPNPINETLEQKEDAEDDGSDSNKRQKLEISTENEKNIVCSFSVAEKMEVSKDGKEDDYKDDENDITGDHVRVEADLVDIGEEIVVADKGNGISVEASEEVDIIEEEDDSEEFDSEEYDTSDYSSYDSSDYSSYDSSDDSSDYSSDDSSDYSSYDSSDDSFFSDSSGDDSDSSKFSGLDSDSDDIRFL
ncbi:hypothetical protein DH2020_009592 [Rehmannia glutinosa]|uniref:Uncharacterized protein n=1 Tax=Rehmannia glutinosa TaxID=99300 RepID=A0ABR0X9H9_REHGL